MGSRPLFILLLGMMVGASLAVLCGVIVPGWSLPVLLALALAAACTPSRSLFMFLLFLVSLGWGVRALQPYLYPLITPGTPAWYASDRNVTLEGVIDTRPDPTESGCRVIMTAQRLMVDGREVSVRGRVFISIGEGHTEVVTGDLVRCVVKLRRPRNLGLPGEFNLVRWLALRDIYVTAHLRDGADLVLIRSRVTASQENRIDRMARRLGREISRVVPGEEGGVLKALLLGDRGEVPRSLETAYARAGVNHILSISGFHVAIVGLALAQLLYLLGRCSERLMLVWNLRQLVLLAGLPFIVFYLFLSGAAPATVRSVVMIILGVLALCLDREVDPVNILIITALLLMGLNPPVLFDLSFQLSFLAIWGLIVLTPLFMAPWKDRVKGRVVTLLTAVAASLAAIVVTLVPVAFYFHRTTVVGIIANLVIVPLMGYGAVVLGFVALLVMVPFPPAGAFLLTLAGFLVHLSDRIIQYLSRLPLLPPWSPSRLDLLLCLLIMMALTFVQGRRLKTVLVAGMVGCMVAVPLAVGGTHTDDMRFYLFSVGQAESSLVRFPDGRTLLIDGGGSLREGGADLGERLLAPALWSLGIDRLDLVILTHPHPDHLKGLRYIVENFPVGEFLESGIPHDGEEHRLLIRALQERGVPVRLVDGDTPPFPVGEGMIEPLAPWRDGDRGGDVNDDSLVFRLHWRDLSLLFTGDAGFATEERLLLHPDRLQAQIFKVAHHGSRFSSSEAFLAAVRPRVALISAGYGNTFQLPDPVLVDRLTRMHIPLYRTDLEGTLLIISNGTGFRVITMPPSRSDSGPAPAPIYWHFS